MSRTIEDYLSLPYTLELIPEPEGGWFVAVKELPGCISEGNNPDDAVAMIRDAMRGWLEVALEDGLSIPEPRPEEDYSGKFVIRVPRTLHRQLVETAEQEGVSLNQYVNVALASAVNRPLASPQPERKEDNWPGLSAAAREVLRAAGLGTEANQQDERLFADWAERALLTCERNFDQGYERDALVTLAKFIEDLRRHAEHSPVVETLAKSCLMIHRVMENSHDLRHGIIEEALIRSQIRRQVTQAYPQAEVRILHEEERAYTALATHPESSLAEDLFAPVASGTKGSRNEW